MSRRRTQHVYIAGIETPCREIHCDFDVDQPIGTGTLVMRSPRLAHVDLAAPVRVEAGYDDEVRIIFDGRLASDTAGFDERGGTLRVAMEGHNKALWFRNDADVGFPGPMSLWDYVIALYYWRGVPHYLVDDTTSPDGATLMLGSNPDYKGGWIPLSTTASPGADIDRIGELFGYRSFDCPDGVTRFKRISGLPDGSYDAPFRAYAQGVNLRSVERSRTLTGIVNYWNVEGPTYTAPDTSEVAIRSFPASITPDERLGPTGVNRDDLQDDILSTVTLADAARNAHEIDSGAPPFRYGWTVRGDPEMQPGQVVTVRSSTLNGVRGGDLIDSLLGLIPVPLWLMRVSHSLTDRGWTTDMEGWAGGGEALPAGNDCVTTLLLGSEGRHLGNEYLSHYRRPNPDGIDTVKIPFTVPNDYSTATIRAKAHGCNSFVRNTESEASRFEIWQTVDGVYKSVMSGEMPRVPEYLERRLDYKPRSLPIRLEDGTTTTNPDYFWQDIVVPLTGRLIAGPADLKPISGKDSDVGDHDDFEISSVYLTVCGVGEPVAM